MQMEHRYLKVALTLSVALLALFYAAHNLANWGAANGAVGYVLGQQDHVVYPTNLAPAVTNPALVAALVILICAFEIASGMLALVGTYRLWIVRRADAAAFQAAKRFAVLGAGLAAITWFLLFAAFGGALYQMWQTDVGAQSLEGAFQFSGLAFLTLIYLSLPELEPDRG
jgi:predicted small integral membrane protein